MSTGIARPSPRCSAEVQEPHCHADQSLVCTYELCFTHSEVDFPEHFNSAYFLDAKKEYCHCLAGCYHGPLEGLHGVVP
jgi:hypothetical protein